jgi:hypothetical protein
LALRRHALFYITYATKEKALSASPTQAQVLLDDAASKAKIALDAPSKPDYMSESDFEKLKAVSSPNFYSAIAIDDAAKRDYSRAIDNFTRELRAPVSVRATESGFELDDTYRLAQAYEDQAPADLKNAAWFYTRRAIRAFDNQASMGGKSRVHLPGVSRKHEWLS